MGLEGIVAYRRASTSNQAERNHRPCQTRTKARLGRLAELYTERVTDSFVWSGREVGEEEHS